MGKAGGQPEAGPPLLAPLSSAQVAEQVRVGTVFVPVKPACMPKVVFPAGAMTLLYGMFRAVTDAPLDVTAAFQLLLMT